MKMEKTCGMYVQSMFSNFLRLLGGSISLFPMEEEAGLALCKFFVVFIALCPRNQRLTLFRELWKFWKMV